MRGFIPQPLLLGTGSFCLFLFWGGGVGGVEGWGAPGMEPHTHKVSEPHPRTHTTLLQLQQLCLLKVYFQVGLGKSLRGMRVILLERGEPSMEHSGLELRGRISFMFRPG